MADEPNIPTHRWYEPRNHIALPREDVTRTLILDSGIQKINAWIAAQPWGTSIYAINGLDPSLVLDFSSEFYRTGGSTTTFDAAMTHSRSGNATMVDSDGLLKWAPHNLLAYSEEFDNVAWNKLNTTASADTITPFATDAFHGVRGASFTSPGEYTLTAEALPNGYNFLILGDNFASGAGFQRMAYFNLSTGEVGSIDDGGSGSPITASIEVAEDGWYRCSVSFTRSSGFPDIGVTNANGARAFLADGVSGIRVRNAHLYRSDLGGMVDNPDTSNSYVPTTSAARYLPRRGHHIYNGAEWVNEGVLVESEARTNLLTYSEDLSDAAWAKVAGVTIGAPVTRKGISLDLIENNGAANYRPVYQSIGSVANGAYATFSVFVEAGTSTETAIRIDESGTNRCTVPITWTSGVPSLQAGSAFGLTFVDASLQDYGDGLYRVHLTALNGTGGALTLLGYYYVQWDDTAAAVNTYAGGFQAEIAPTPSSYIPTSGSTVTRSAEVITVPSANLPYSATAMSIQMDGKMTYADTAVSSEIRFVRWLADNTNYIISDYATDGAYDRMKFEQRSSGTIDNVQNTSAPYSPGINVPYNIASRHGSTFINGSVDGTALTANTTPTALPDLSSTDLNLAFDYMGTIKKFRVWSDDLGDTGIAEAST